jgi:hypothetical protein
MRANNPNSSLKVMIITSRTTSSQWGCRATDPDDYTKLKCQSTQRFKTTSRYHALRQHSTMRAFDGGHTEQYRKSLVDNFNNPNSSLKVMIITSRTTSSQWGCRATTSRYHALRQHSTMRAFDGGHTEQYQQLSILRGLNEQGRKSLVDNFNNPNSSLKVMIITSRTTSSQCNETLPPLLV